MLNRCRRFFKNTTGRFWIAVLVFLMLQPMFSDAVSEEAKAYRIYTLNDACFMHEAASNESWAVKVMADGDEVIVGMQSGKWSCVKDRRGAIGWIETRYLSHTDRMYTEYDIYKVITDSIILRSSPNAGANAVGRLALNTEVIIENIVGDWCSVQTRNGRTGYVPLSCLINTRGEYTQELQMEDMFVVGRQYRVRVQSGRLNLRARPSTSSKVMERLEDDTVVQLIREISGGWGYVRSASQKEGYVRLEYLNAYHSS